MDPSSARHQQTEALHGRQLFSQGDFFATAFHNTQPIINQQAHGFASTQGYMPMHQQNRHMMHEQPVFPQMGPGPICGSGENKDPGIWIDINIYVNPRNQADLYSKIPNLQKFLSMTGSEPNSVHGAYLDCAQYSQSTPRMFEVPVHSHAHEPKHRTSFRSNPSEPAFYSDPSAHNLRNLSGLKVSHHPETLPPYSNCEARPEPAPVLDHRNNFAARNVIQPSRPEPSRIAPSDRLNYGSQPKDSMPSREQRPGSQIQVLERVGIRPSNPVPPLSSTEAAFRGFINQISRDQKPAEERNKPVEIQQKLQNSENEDNCRAAGDSESEEIEESNESQSQNSDEEVSKNVKMIPPLNQRKQSPLLPRRNFDFINSVPIKQTSQDILQAQQRPSFSFQHQTGSRITESIPLTKRDVTDFKNEIHVTQRAEDKIANSRNLATQIKKIKYFWRGTNFNYPYTHRRKYQRIERSGEDRFFTEIIDFSKKVIQPNINIDQKYV